MEAIAQTRIQVKVLSILGSKLDAKADCFKPVKFNISANLEELEHGFNSISLGFSFTIITEPKVVKYHVQGRADIQGRAEHIKKVMTAHPSTRVPIVLYDIYQQVYAQIFVLSKMIDAPSPSPELLSIGQASAGQERGQIDGGDEAANEISDELISSTEQVQGKENIVDDEEIPIKKSK
ncbi:MAG: hypothetical protein QXU32_00225 [Nitrososphaerales archaeon]